MYPRHPRRILYDFELEESIISYDLPQDQFSLVSLICSNILPRNFLNDVVVVYYLSIDGARDLILDMPYYTLF